MNDEPLVCPISKWYLRRLAMLMVLTGGLGLYFLYDGSAGYPGKNHLADLHEVFEATARGERPEIDLDDPDRSEKRKRELEEAQEAARGGASWAGFAAERMLAETKPKRYSEKEIREQFFFAGLMAAVTLGIGIFALTRRNRFFIGDADGIGFPNGRRVSYDSIREIDLGKFDRGIARLRYDEAGEERFAKVDDYKYAGTVAILRRATETSAGIAITGDPRWLEYSEEALEEKARTDSEL